MAQSTITIVIVIAVIFLYATEKLPLSLTTILAMIAMVFFKILTPAEAFSGFSSTATLLLVGITIIGEAFLTSGLVDKLGDLLMKIARVPLPLFTAIIFMVGSLLSAFLNGLAVVAIFMPILDALAYRTGGKLKKKYTLMPLAIGAVLGGNLSVVGSTSMINASNLLEESYYGKALSFFTPAAVAIPAVLAAFFFYLLIGEKLQEKCFDFEETSTENLVQEESHTLKSPATWKAFFVILVMVLCVVGFVSGLDLAAVAFAGAAAVLISGCISTKQAYTGISWETVFVISGTIGFAKGVEVSGAGKMKR